MKKRIRFFCLTLLVMVAGMAAAQTYTVAGPASIFGDKWNPGTNFMEQIPNTDYYRLVITKKNLAAGDYEYKVANGSWGQSWPSSGNAKFTIDETGTHTIIFSFNSKDGQFSANVISTVSVVGSAIGSEEGNKDDILFEKSWDPASNDMSLQSDGTYKWSKNGVELHKGNVLYKAVANHDWNNGINAFPLQNATLEIPSDGIYNCEFTFDPFTKEVSATATNCVAQIGNNYYSTLQEAVSSATSSETIQIIKAGDYTLPSLPKNITVEGAVDGVVFNHTTSGSVASIPNGATFKNVVFNFGNVNYHGFQHAGTINMEGCTLNGKFFSYGDMNFTNCQFVQTNSDYHMWCYSGNTTYTGCTFTNSVTGKFLNVYNESGATKYTVTVNNCKFVNNASTANKAALNVKATSGTNLLAYDVIINNCTTDGAFPEASSSDVLVVLNPVVQVDDRTASGVDNITVTQDNALIYPVTYVAQIDTKKYETLEAAFAAAQDGETITLLADCTGNGIKAPQGKFTQGLTVDFAGHTYTVDGATVGSSGTETNGFQLLKDNKITFKGGTITSEKAKILVQNYSDLTLEGMTLTLDNANYTSAYTLSNNNGKVVIDGTTINANPAGGFAFDVCRYESYSSVNVTVKGESKINGDVEVFASNNDAKDGFKLMLEAGTMTGNIVLDASAKAAMAATPEKALVMKSETFTKDAPADYKWVAAEEGTQKLVPCEYVAQIDTKKYETLEAAFAAAQDGETITVLTDIDLPSTIAVTKQVTLDLNRKTISNTSDLWVGGNWSFFSVQANGNLTVTGNGTIDAKENDCFTFDVRDGGILTIKDGTYTGNISSVYLINEAGTGVSTCNIEGGTFSIKQLDETGGYNFLLNCRDASYTSNTAKFNVTGGSFVNYNPANNLAEGEATNFCAAGYEAVQDGNVWTVQRIAVAKIDETKYYSLAEAVAAVPENGTETTITMIADENVVGNAGATISKSQNVKLDLNGKTVTLNVAESKGSQLITNNGTLTIVDSSEEQNGKLTNAAAEGLGVGTWPSNNYVTNIITNTGTLNIEAGTIQNTANGSICYAVDNNSTSGNATLNIKGGVLTAVGTAVRQFCNSTTNENNVNISGGEVVTNGSAALWVQLPNSDATKAPKATLNVTGGTLSGNTYAFYDYSYGNSFDATQYNLSGGTFNGGIFSYGANMTISDGEYNSWIAIKQAKPSNVAVTGGKFADDVYTYGDNASKGFITGGIFAINTYEDEGNTYNCDWLYCLADGYVVSDNTDPETMVAYPYAVRQAHYIAAIGETKYETLQAAINACEAGTETTIKLLDNVTDGAGFAIPDGVTNMNIIIDFDGNSYNVTKDAVGSGNTKSQAMHFYSGNTLTLKNGTITSADTSEENKLKMMMQNYCNLTLDGMTIDCSNVNGGTYPDYSGTAYEYWSNKSVPVFNFNTGNATIKNTTITFRDGDNVGLCVDGGTVALGEGTVVNGPVSAVTGTVTITDGKYSGAITADQATLTISGGIFTLEPAEEYLAENYVVTENKDATTSSDYPYTVKTKEDAGVFELWDNKADYVRDTTVKASKISYFRSFSDKVTNHRQCWFVPFDYTVTDNDKEIFKFYKIHMVAAADEGVSEVTDNTQVYVYIEEMTGENIVLKANRPYVIKPNKVLTDYEFIAKNVDLEGRNTGSRLNVTTAEFNYDFYGTYSRFEEENQEPHSWISINTGGNLFWNKETSYTNRYRWYIKITKNSTNEGYAKPNLIFVEDDGDSDSMPTDISASSIDGEIEGFYTVGGVKLDHPIKGLNIIRFTDGTTKKIFIK